MKEEYYTDSLIEKQAQDFLDRVIFLRDRHHYFLDPKKIALLIIDCQKFFFDISSHAFIPSAKAIFPKIRKLQDHCLQRNITVIKTRHINDRERCGMMCKWWGDHLPMRGDPLVSLVSEIVVPGDIIIDKSQYDAFYQSRLESLLQSSGIEQLIITGVMTNLCCETTARVAFTKGYEVFFCIDGTATYNREFHLGSLMNLAHGFAIPMLVDEIIDELKDG